MRRYNRAHDGRIARAHESYGGERRSGVVVAAEFWFPIGFSEERSLVDSTEQLSQ